MNNIKIINGIMEPVFDENVYEYTVTVSKDVISLIFDCDFGDATITIYGNDFLSPGENHVILEVYDNELKTYNFKVLKEEESTALEEIDAPKTVEVSIKEDILSDMLAPTISVICFLIIAFLYFIIFKRKNVNK